jgi:Flp pilus assembly protein TadG
MTHNPRSSQRGVFTVITALAAVLLVVVLGFVVDGSRLMVVQGELQNATDACALSAAAELNGLPGASLRAAASGSRVASTLNKQNFQSTAAAVSPSDVRFSTSLNGVYVAAPASTTATTNYRFVECTAMHTGWINLVMDWAGFGDSLPVATSRAGLQRTRKVCAPPLALVVRSATGPDFGYTSATTAAVVLTNLRYADLVNTSLTGADAQYANLLAQSGVCGVTTVAGTMVGVDGPNTMATSLSTALKARYESDPTYGTGTGLSNRRLMAVPFVNASSTTSSSVLGWACLELGPGGSVTYRSDARRLTSSLPSSNCVTVGVGGNAAEGPYAPTLAR